MDLVTILAEGTMKAAAVIIDDRNLPSMTDDQLTKVVTTMREELTSNYDSVVQESKEALSISLEHAKYVLNVNCNLFAVRALRAAGVLPETVTDDVVFEGVKE